MIYTLTLNPSIDYFLEVDSFNEGNLNIAQDSSLKVGGKGINVSLVLNNLQVKSVALGFAGGFTGQKIIQNLSENNIESKFLNIEGNSRINIKLYNKESKKESEIAGVSPNINKNQIDELINKIISLLKQDDILVLSGSIPSSLQKDIYKIISQKLNHIKIVLDTRGESIKENLYNNFLIKPNQKELEDMVGKKLSTNKEIIEASQYLLNQGLENIIVSKGAEGSLLLNKNKIYQALPLKIDTKNAVGAGDSMVAGFLYGYTSGKTIEESYKLAVASSCATISGEGFATIDKIQEFYNKVIIKEYLP